MDNLWNNNISELHQSNIDIFRFQIRRIKHVSTEWKQFYFIKWNNTDTDTIKTYFRRGIENNTDYEICEKIWLNEILIWDISTLNGVTEREITILK